MTAHTLVILSITPIFASAGEQSVNFLDLVPLLNEQQQSNIQWLQQSPKPTNWSDDIGKPGDQHTALQTNIKLNTSLSTANGWHAGYGNLSGGNDISNVSQNGFSYKGRFANGGEFVLLTVTLNSLGADATLTGLNLSGTLTGGSTGVGLYYQSGDTVTTLWNTSSQGNFTYQSESASFTPLSADDNVYLLFSCNSNGGAAATVSNLNFTGTYELPLSVPEPSLPLLYSLALCLPLWRRQAGC